MGVWRWSAHLDFVTTSEKYLFGFYMECWGDDFYKKSQNLKNIF